MTNAQLQKVVDRLQALIDAAEEKIDALQSCEHERDCTCADKAEAVEMKRDACQEALDALEGVMD